MTRRVVAIASTVIFVLIALMAHLLVGMHDRSAPVALGAPPRLMLDFSKAHVKGDGALAALRRIDSANGVGLVKLSANLSGDHGGVVLLPVNLSRLTGDEVARYEDPSVRVGGMDDWTYTTAAGAYFVAGDQSGLVRTVGELERLGVVVDRQDTTVRSGFVSVLRIKGMLLALITCCMLLVTLVLYWLGAQSRRRALNVLAGAPLARIQAHDLTQLLLLVVSVWIPVAFVAAVFVGLLRGWVFVPVFVGYLLLLGVLLLVVTLGAALAMSAVSIPSPGLIARRAPATAGVRRSAVALKGLVFVMVLLMIGPTWVALTEARERADRLQRWERLANYAVIGSPDAADSDFGRLEGPIGDMVRDAKAQQAVLYSESFLPFEGDPIEMRKALPFQRELAGRWTGLVLVNEGWLEVGVGADRNRLSSLPEKDLPHGLVPELGLWFKGIWGHDTVPAETTVAGLRYFAPTGGPVPIIDPAGDLDYRDDVLLVVVPDLVTTLNDKTLASAAISRRLLFGGLDETQRLIESHGLAKEIKPYFAAEDGVLLAQFAAFEAWLGSASILGLGVALTIAAAISAYIAMLLQAKNDFVRRLSGQPWLRVMSRRVVPEVVIGGVLATGILLLQPTERMLPVAVAALLLLGTSPLAHIVAARRGFADVTARRL